MRVIDADVLIVEFEILRWFCQSSGGNMDDPRDKYSPQKVFEQCVTKIEVAPTVNVMPVVMSHWTYLGAGHWTCNACHGRAIMRSKTPTASPGYAFCPNCGAKMGKE